MNPTDEVVLGSTGVRVTRLGLGTAPIGNLQGLHGDSEAAKIVELAYEVGVRYVDTAPYYGCGVAERRVGAVLQAKGRESFVLSTKVGRLIRAGDEGEPCASGLRSVFDFSYDGVMRSLEESLERLGLDRVDILFIHDPDAHYDGAVRGAYPTLRRLRDEGTVGAIGVGMNGAEMLVRFARETDVDCFLLAGRYTLLDQSGLAELFPLCTERGIGIVAGGVFNSGVLANPSPQASYFYRPVPEEVLHRVHNIERICRRYDVPLKAAAIQFPLGHPAVRSVLVGVESCDELRDDIALFQHPIPPELWRDLQREGVLAPDAPLPGEEAS
jgi:D-threo-aldose 1-dehydrogenase